MSNYGPASQATGDYQFTCRNCHEKFYTDNARQLYCCRKCKRSAQNRRAYKKRRKVIRIQQNPIRFLTPIGMGQPTYIDGYPGISTYKGERYPVFVGTEKVGTLVIIHDNFGNGENTTSQFFPTPGWRVEWEK